MKFKGLTENERSLRGMNIILCFLITFIVIYFSVLVYGKDLQNDLVNLTQSKYNISQSNRISSAIEKLNIPCGLTNSTTENFIFKKEYNKGDLVYIKYFNIYGIIEDKSSLSKGYYRVIYKDTTKKLESVILPVEFLLQPPLTSSTLLFIQ